MATTIPNYSYFFGLMGAATSLVFSCLGSAYGTCKSGVGVVSVGVMRPDLVMKAIIPCVMAGIIGLYGLVVAIYIAFNINPTEYSAFKGFSHLAAGLSVGLSGLGAGMSIGIVGDAGVRAYSQQPKLFIALMLILIFSEALGLYGLIVGIVLVIKS
ncbi:uncharacterized protein LOC126323745 [Schistocerca gregaria]|uniref:uncharacterized protein LOC126323745 n=1 Tax=Schistocerca gregaria TaxID=7010 RepID=UPI00211E829F|nr:uncharacterized protein LOC126323745 [Schistocerca gregaria]